MCIVFLTIKCPGSKEVKNLAVGFVCNGNILCRRIVCKPINTYICQGVIQFSNRKI